MFVPTPLRIVFITISVWQTASLCCSLLFEHQPNFFWLSRDLYYLRPWLCRPFKDVAHHACVAVRVITLSAKIINLAFGQISYYLLRGRARVNLGGWRIARAIINVVPGYSIIIRCRPTQRYIDCPCTATC